MCVPGIPALGGSENGRPTLSWPWLRAPEREKAQGYHTTDYGRVALTEVPGASQAPLSCNLDCIYAGTQGQRVDRIMPHPVGGSEPLNTSNKGPCGRTGKGVMTANRGRNTFHCPLVPRGGRMSGRDCPSNNEQAHSWGAGRDQKEP